MSELSRSLRAMGVPGLALALLALLAMALVALPSHAQSDPPPAPAGVSQQPDRSPHNQPDMLSQRALLEQFEATARAWDLQRPAVITYTIQPGDNDWSIARRFGLDIDTLRFSNEWMRRNPDLIHPGKEIIILPLKGAYHTVQAGDTLESIGRRYGVSAADIREFPLNGLTGEEVLVPGQQVVIPGGRLDYAERILPPGPGSGYSIAWPMRGTVSQGYRTGHLALDIASYYGARVYASRGGTVTYARFSPGGWLGFTVNIAHDNGLQTRYSHLSGIFVEEGQVMARGDLIGQVGSTGNSTGPHVHFEVLQSGAKVNPLGLLPPSAAQ